MILRCLLIIAVTATANAQFGGFGNIAKDPVGTAAKTAQTAQGALTDWLSFKTKYNKFYSPAEEAIKQANFVKNLDFITKFAQDVAAGLTNFDLKLNEFGDMLNEEFNKFLNGFHPAGHTPSLAPLPVDDVGQAPNSINWVEKGAVSPIKHQGLCNSCHAFAACAAVEGHNFRKSGKLVELSPQNVLDCGKEGYASFGCTGGGYVDEDYKYIKDKGGANLLDSYPYEAKDGECKFDGGSATAGIAGYAEVPPGDEAALEKVVGTLGPVAVGIDASKDTFRFYSKGIYDDKECGNQDANINHAVLIVGYGEEDGKPYWLVKNSYGTDWGMDGYIKMAKGVNQCGIARVATYPKV